MKKSKIIAIVERTDTGFSAFAEDYAVYTTGKSFTEIQKNMLSALNFYFEDENRKITEKEMHLQIDLKQFFQYYKVLNAKFLAKRIGIHPTLFSQYVQGRKKPSSKQSEKIFNGIKEIGKELSEIRFTA